MKMLGVATSSKARPNGSVSPKHSKGRFNKLDEYIGPDFYMSARANTALSTRTVEQNVKRSWGLESRNQGHTYINIENGWNPDADVNGNNKIDMLDIAIVSRNSGKGCSPQSPFLLYSLLYSENARSSIACSGSTIVARWNLRCRASRDIRC